MAMKYRTINNIVSLFCLCNKYLQVSIYMSLYTESASILYVKELKSLFSYSLHPEVTSLASIILINFKVTPVRSPTRIHVSSMQCEVRKLAA